MHVKLSNETMARPLKDAKEKRSEQTKERWTTAELEQLNEQARLSGLTRAEYIRRRALGHRITSVATRTDPALIVALNRVGNNVNQLTLSVHRGSAFQKYWREVGDELRTVLHSALEGIK